MPDVCDYSDTDYKKDFWDAGSRVYEDLIERYALRKLLPDKGNKLIEIGGGFGRLMEEYTSRFKSVVIFDYAENLLSQAREKAEKLGFGNIVTEQGNIYEAGKKHKDFDCCVMVRVLHHIEDVPAALRQVHALLRDGGLFIMEYANKRNILEIGRFALGRSMLRPFSWQPSKRGEKIFYNFHPAFIKKELEKCGFVIEEELMASIFRSNILKKMFGQRTLANIENVLQKRLGMLKLSPSVFIAARKTKGIQG